MAIVDAYASPTIVSDATTYAQRNDPTHPFKKSKFSQKAYRPFYDGGPNKCDASGWYGEETLDVEAVHTMAPGASIYFVGVKSCNNPDFITALNDLVDGHKADIVSNSYGDLGESTAADRNANGRIFTQAAIQGIGFYFSSGDSGDESSSGYGGPIPSADFPASSPLVTAVGGTSLGVDANGGVALEQGWTTGISGFDPATGTYTPGPRGDFLYGAGGGPSRVYAAARLPEGRRAQQPRHQPRPAEAAGRARRRDGRRPQHRLPRRPDPDLPGGRQLRRVPHRRHQPVVPAVRRGDGAGRPAGRRAPRLRQPVPLLAGRLGRAA